MFRPRKSGPLPSISSAGMLVGAFMFDPQRKLMRNRPPAVAAVEEERQHRRRSVNGLMLTDSAAALEPREVVDRSGARL